ncbi:uncharacterized protein ZBAI_01811 [Zygosaccharomyces bailii ISA1307]|nr:uncharacterized protein ZBAI_01811 [Zygosaccharomyces bailii ISA1307]
MAVLVTGATRFIAYYVIEYLLQANYNVVGTVRSPEKAERLYRQFRNNPKLSLEIVEDIAQIGALIPFFRNIARKSILPALPQHVYLALKLLTCLSQLNAFNKFINHLLHSTPGRGIEPNPHLEFTDVRDVAKAHLLAFQRDNTAGQRLGLSEGKFGNQCILDIVNCKFPSLRDKIAEGANPEKGDQTPGCCFDNSHSRNILNFDFISLERRVCDTEYQILQEENRLR